MWPKPRKENHLIITIHQTTIIIGCVSVRNHHITLESYALFQPSCISYTTLVQSITAFKKQHNLGRYFASFALGSSFISQHFVRMPTNTPSRADFKTITPDRMITYYQYLLTEDDGTALFYLCASYPWQLYLIELVCKKAGITLLSVTSDYMAFMSLYKKIYGAAYRQAQLALDLVRSNYDLAHILSESMIQRLIHIPLSLKPVPKQVVALLAGTFFHQHEEL